ncbi:VOC family protein [Arthrobacter agilis]|uniref:VOC family protein n=1 Tax=Arthrobacter agilis TaxID=37921 RepID=UPI001ABF2D77
MHRILLREVVIDAPSETFAATRDFWAAALLTDAQPVKQFPEFTALPQPAALSWVGLQDIGPARTARYHLDIEADDVNAEVDRLERLGAVQVAVGRTWVSMQDPAGLLFDVVPAESPSFEQHARSVQ